MNAPNYKPLHLLPPTTTKKTLIQKVAGYLFESAADWAQNRDLIRQIKDRADPVPPEAWGSDPRRRDVATTMAELIKDILPWPNAHFTPDDPFDLLFFNYSSQYVDGLDLTEVVMRLEEMYELNINDPEQIFLDDPTFGEVVDFLISPQPDLLAIKDKNTLWTKEGPDALESMPCPTLATFLDLRACVTRNEAEALRITPATRLKDLKRNKGLFSALNNYIDRRFGIRDTLLPVLECLDPMLLGLSASFAVLVGWLALVAADFVMDPVGFDHSMWSLPLAFFLLALLFTSPLILRPLFSRSFWKLLLNKRPKPETVGDLVKHILKERNPHNLPAA